MKEWFDKGWSRKKCDVCDGTGMISVYSYGGEDFEGPGECPCCFGRGSYWVTPKGRHVEYPGGRFC